jgi:hypothetical protein
MAVDVDIYVGFPILLPPKGSAAAEEHISAEWVRWPLSSIP